ncbi:unnamed protein product [Clonostachys chloroleuca]|uniref:Major facilitator superfamily (MFS) profile domain-containing protein n=1 Tax=Clonostachys chloroleuca TaxID=1926264 RepID=A0AA35Q8B5_9HYPO|nr:unnamed protein product [Clonostachys chloroleuca]
MTGGKPPKGTANTGSTTQCPLPENEKVGIPGVSEVNHNASPYLAGLKLFILMGGLTVVMFLAMLDMAIIGTAIPQISSDFHRLQDVGWYIGAYQLASATVQPLTGKAYTYFSTKWSLLFFFFVFEVGSAICGAAQNSIMFIIGRSIAGLGCSGLSNGSLTVLSGAVSPEKRPFGQIGVILGPILGGVLTEHATWRWCFYVNLPLGGLVAAFLVFLHIPDHIVKEPITTQHLREILPKFDLVGFALFAPAAIMLLLALQFGSSDYSWKSATVIGCFCGAGVTAVVFLLWERSMGKDAMMPLQMISRRIVWTSSLFYGLLMSVSVGGGSFLPIYFQSVKGHEPLTSALYLLPSILSQIIFLLISGALMTKFRFYIPWAAFAASSTALGCGLISTWAPDSTLGKLFGHQVPYAARGAAIQIAFLAVQLTLPANEIALGMSFLVFSQNILGAIVVTLGNTIFQETLKSKIVQYAPEVSPEAAVAAGGSADAVRQLAAQDDDALLGNVLRAFSDSFDNIMYLFVAMSVVSFFLCFGMGWIDLQAHGKKPEEAAAREQKEDGEMQGV